jgi:ATP-binding cassette subfamily B protein
MDCGPAALKALLEGFRVPVSYGRLREACHTEVDGTSIDTVEELAVELGLQAEQVMVPVDHVLLTAALPAIAVVTSPIGGAHFVVAWRRHGPVVQIMDPARGRLWLSTRAFLESLYVHSTIVPAADWRSWAGTEAFLAPLRRRLQAVGLSRRASESHLTNATADQSWRGLGSLDAATRMVASLRAARTLNRREARKAFSALLLEAARDPSTPAIPDHYWSARAADGDDVGEQVRVRGAVLVRADGRVKDSSRSRGADRQSAGEGAPSREVAAALTEAPARPLRDAFLALKSDGILMPAVVGCATAIAVTGVLLEAVLLRSVLDAGTFFSMPEQGMAAAVVLGAFALAMLTLEFALGSAERQAGRRLETRLRVAFLDKIPRLADTYFQSRPVSDMAERSHAVHLLRTLPQLGIRGLRVAVELAVTTMAIAWLDPGMAALALLTAVAAAGIPLLGHSMMAERDLRVRTHAGALGRFHLDSLLGRTAIEAHGASGTIEREHESLLREWTQASLRLQRGSLVIEGLQMIVGFGLAGWILFGHLAAGNAGGTLLLAYWVLNLPTLGYELALHAREYPAHRSTIVRLLEPLGAPEAVAHEGPIAQTRRDEHPRSRGGVRIDARQLSVRAAGHQILDNVDLHIAPSTHVAIVGASGAGKSTLLALLLGWYRPASGELLIDGEPLTGALIEQLRRETAWVDPSVQLWNRSLLDNLLYGSDAPESLGPVLEAAGLLPVIAKLPNGLATPLGEGGRLLSAGEAQRVRLGRAMLRHQPRLVVLDEPFMGLERDRRRTLLNEARQRWAACTFIYVTHEIAEARSFDRVLVLDRGRVVEDGDPRLLGQMASSRYRRLLQAQDAVQARFGASAEWHRVRVHDGRIVRDLGNATIEQTA